MSGSDQKDGGSKSVAVSARLRQFHHENAQRRRESALTQQTRSLRNGAELTQSDTRPDTQHNPHVDGAADMATASAVVAFAVSAGGLVPLMTILNDLPVDFRGAVIVAQHMGPGSVLADVLQYRCRLPVKFAETGELIRGGAVYVPLPLQHLIVNANRTFTLIAKKRLRFARPSADWLFDTLAATYTDRAIGVVLSGCQRDGARGVVRIFEAGGTTIVQDPKTCEVADMPEAAIRSGAVTFVLTPSEIAPVVVARILSCDQERMGREFENPFAATA
jgi:two-component system, chemotaxis family, protein-glutamate methylesterase/glutaminase